MPSFLNHVALVGGPPVVLPSRVKVGGLDSSDDDCSVTTFVAMAPCPVTDKNKHGCSAQVGVIEL